MIYTRAGCTTGGIGFWLIGVRNNWFRRDLQAILEISVQQVVFFSMLNMLIWNNLMLVIVWFNSTDKRISRFIPFAQLTSSPKNTPIFTYTSFYADLLFLVQPLQFTLQQQCKLILGATGKLSPHAAVDTLFNKLNKPTSLFSELFH